MVYTRVPYCTKTSGGIWSLVVSTNFSSNHSCCCVLFSAIAITHISSCCRRAAIRWGRTLVTLEFGADEVKPPETKKDQEQLVYRQIIIIASSNLPQWLMCFVGFKWQSRDHMLNTLFLGTYIVLLDTRNHKGYFSETFWQHIKVKLLIHCKISKY